MQMIRSWLQIVRISCTDLRTVTLRQDWPKLARSLGKSKVLTSVFMTRPSIDSATLSLLLVELLRAEKLEKLFMEEFDGLRFGCTHVVFF